MLRSAEERMVFMKHDPSRFQISNTYKRFYFKNASEQNRRKQHKEGRENTHTHQNRMKNKIKLKSNGMEKSGRNVKKEQNSIWQLRGQGCLIRFLSPAPIRFVGLPFFFSSMVFVSQFSKLYKVQRMTLKFLVYHQRAAQFQHPKSSMRKACWRRFLDLTVAHNIVYLLFNVSILVQYAFRTHS